MSGRRERRNAGLPGRFNDFIVDKLMNNSVTQSIVEPGAGEAAAAVTNPNTTSIGDIPEVNNMHNNNERGKADIILNSIDQTAGNAIGNCENNSSNSSVPGNAGTPNDVFPPPIHNNKTDDASVNVYNALIFACENKNKIGELTNELKTVSAELGTMQEHFNRAVIEQSRALLAIFGAIYGSQIDDIKHDYDQNEVENKMISNGLAWAADIKLQKKQPNYRDAVMRYLNEVGTSNG